MSADVKKNLKWTIYFLESNTLICEITIRINMAMKSLSSQ